MTAFEADKQVVSGNPITRDITGEEYYSTLYSIRESKIQKDLIWTGSNDGIISLTKDGGQTWENVTPKKMLKGGRVESVEPSQFDPAKAYISVDRHLLGDNIPYFYMTKDFGKNWELISTATNGIPADYTAKVLREDPVKEGLLYAGTEYGMFVSFDEGKKWKPFQQNLPITPITDVIIHRGDLVISTMGRGFWILDNITSLRNPEIADLNDKPILFKPDTTIRYRTGRASSDFPNYPATSVIIDYYLPNDITKDVQLKILDANKKSIVTIVSDSTQLTSTSEEVEDMGLNMTFSYLDTKLETKKGLNRFAWDLKQKGAWSDKKSRLFKNGPMVPPGMYTLSLTVGKETLEQTFEIMVDPRLEKEGITSTTFQEQLAFENKVISLLSEARKFQVKVEAELKKSTNSEKKASLEKVLKELKNEEGAYPQQMLVAQISYLSYIVGDTDKEIGKDAKERYIELVSKFDQLKSKAGI